MPLYPSLPSVRGTVYPRSLGTMNSDMPRCRGSASTSVFTSTARQLPSRAFVIHIFVPFSR